MGYLDSPYYDGPFGYGVCFDLSLDGSVSLSGSDLGEVGTLSGILEVKEYKLEGYQRGLLDRLAEEFEGSIIRTEGMEGSIRYEYIFPTKAGRREFIKEFRALGLIPVEMSYFEEWGGPNTSRGGGWDG